jgi:hypothetical protein
MNARARSGLALALPVVAAGLPALAQPMTVGVSRPAATLPSNVRFQVGTHDCIAPIPPGSTGQQKKSAVVQSLMQCGVPTDPGQPLQSFFDIFPDWTDIARFHVMDSAEPIDSLSVPGAKIGAVHFQGPFQPFNPMGQPAIFSAGIVTDVGQLTAQVSAQELNFQTDGPIICQALFQRLAHQLPPYGGMINYAGDRLEVYFDPAYTVTQGGVIFGTTSTSPGCTGRLDMPGTTSTLTIREGPSFSPVPSFQRITLGSDTYTVPIPPNASASMKCDCIAARCGPGGITNHPVFHNEGSDTVRIPDLAPGTPVLFECMESADMPVMIRFNLTTLGEVGFVGHFDPMGGNFLPAQFTAGIVTDVGELSAVVSAQELNFQTDGPIICQALFQRLAPRAPQYGAQINYAGDRLEVYFDPAYTVTQGGIIFGTSSTSPGCYGGLNLPPPPPQPGRQRRPGRRGLPHHGHRGRRQPNGRRPGLQPRWKRRSG